MIDKLCLAIGRTIVTMATIELATKGYKRVQESRLVQKVQSKIWKLKPVQRRWCVWPMASLRVSRKA